MAQVDRTSVIAGQAVNRAGLIAGTWGVVGFALLIARAVVSMSSGIHETLLTPLTGAQLLVFAAATIVFGVMKGFYIFHQRFCPRYVDRVRELCTKPLPGIYLILAPLFCLGLIGADRSRLVSSYLIIAGVAVMIASTGAVPFPWKGMILTGVSAALVWAALEISFQGIREIMLVARRVES